MLIPVQKGSSIKLVCSLSAVVCCFFSPKYTVAFSDASRVLEGNFCPNNHSNTVLLLLLCSNVVGRLMLANELLTSHITFSFFSGAPSHDHPVYTTRILSSLVDEKQSTLNCILFVFCIGNIWFAGSYNFLVTFLPFFPRLARTAMEEGLHLLLYWTNSWPRKWLCKPKGFNDNITNNTH